MSKETKETIKKVYECSHCGRSKEYDYVVGTIGPLTCGQCGGPLCEEGDLCDPEVFSCYYEDV